MMKLEVSAKIESDTERVAVREQFVRRLATSYGDHADIKTLYATYIGDDQATIDAFIQTFGRYPEHSIELKRGGD